MKKNLFFLLLLVFYSNLQAQYTVTKVIGIVKNKTSGEILKTGSKLTDDDILIFSSPADVVRVIVAGKGVFIISPTTRTLPQKNEIVEMLRSALKVKYKEGYLSGRSTESEMIPSALETQEIINTKTLIKNINKYVFDINKYNSSKGRFFLQIEEEGTGTRIQPLKSIGDTLIIYADDFQLKENTNSGKTFYKLGYFSKEQNNSELLVIIDPYFDSGNEMEAIMQVVIEGNENVKKEAIEQACYSEIYAALGKPSPVIFKTIFNNLVTNVSQK